MHRTSKPWRQTSLWRRAATATRLQSWGHAHQTSFPMGQGGVWVNLYTPRRGYGTPDRNKEGQHETCKPSQVPAEGLALCGNAGRHETCKSSKAPMHHVHVLLGPCPRYVRRRGNEQPRWRLSPECHNLCRIIAAHNSNFPYAMLAGAPVHRLAEFLKPAGLIV